MTVSISYLIHAQYASNPQFLGVQVKIATAQTTKAKMYNE